MAHTDTCTKSQQSRNTQSYNANSINEQQWDSNANKSKLKSYPIVKRLVACAAVWCQRCLLSYRLN